MIIIFLFIALLVFLYTLLITGFLLSWKKFPDFKAAKDNGVFLTVVVPFYNEEDHLENLVTDLTFQDYPAEKFEVILVDDYSDDDSFKMAKTFCGARENFRVVRNIEEKGKKYALKHGAGYAKGNYILITDADCRLPLSWISTFGNFIGSHKESVLISSAVVMPAGRFFNGIFQSLEFSSLVISGAASFIQQSPIMCNAANLAFKKSLLMEAFDEMHPTLNTGDDMFLMLYAKRIYPGKIHFLKNRNAFTSTLPVKGWVDLLRQRTRWASKAGLYKDKRLKYVSLVVLLTNLAITLLAILLFLNLKFGIAFLAAFIMKSIPDYLLLRSFLGYTGQSKTLRFLVPSQIFYIIFIPVTAIAGLFHTAKRR